MQRDDVVYVPRKLSLKMTYRQGLRVIISLLLFIELTSTSRAAATANENLWYSLYFQSMHSGYSHVVSAPDVWQGHKVTREDSITITKLTVMGTVVSQNIVSHSYSDPKSGQPYYQTFRIESGGSVMDVSATFTPRAVLATLKSGSEVTSKVLPIPAGEKIVDGNTEGMSSDGPLKIGQTETDLELNPVSLTLDKQVCVVKAVNIPVKDARSAKIRSTAEISVTDPDGSVTAFQDNSGTPILMLMPADMVMICTDEAHAQSDSSSQAAYAVNPLNSGTDLSKNYNPAPDLAVITSVSPTGVVIKDERTLLQLTAKLSVEGRKPEIVTETAIPVPPPDSAAIGEAPQSAAPFLAPAPYLTVDDPSIKAVVQQVVGGETDSYQAVKLLHDWVNAHMTPVGSLGLPRSATDILANPQGVCRDYAVLYTTLARTAGIPTKINAGLVGFHGRFYYHAWASAYIGGSVGWLPVDPTLPTMFVDATHIPLGTGDATVMFNLSGVIGNTKVETLNTRNSL